MAARPDQHPEDLALHLDLHRPMMMMKTRSKWQVRAVLSHQVVHRGAALVCSLKSTQYWLGCSCLDGVLSLLCSHWAAGLCFYEVSLNGFSMIWVVVINFCTAAGVLIWQLCQCCLVCVKGICSTCHYISWASLYMLLKALTNENLWLPASWENQKRKQEDYLMKWLPVV